VNGVQLSEPHDDVVPPHPTCRLTVVVVEEVVMVVEYEADVADVALQLA
jgi:hypothetical protein